MNSAAQTRAAKLAAVPWWRYAERSRLRYPTKSMAEGAARAAEILQPSDMEDVAHGLFEDEWRTRAWNMAPNTNRWHPRLTDERRRMSAQISAAVIEQKIYSHMARNGRSWPVADLPRVLPLLTPEQCREHLDKVAADIAVDVASDEFLTAGAEHGARDHHSALIVEHPATGIRAVFYLPDAADESGHVLSKPYRVSPLHPTLRRDWERYAGLGVGTRVYLEASRHHPEVRWGHGALSEYSAPLRRRLHHLDPYRWYYTSCRWCADHGLSGQAAWMKAGQAAFDNHVTQAAPESPSFTRPGLSGQVA